MEEKKLSAYSWEEGSGVPEEEVDPFESLPKEYWIGYHKQFAHEKYYYVRVNVVAWDLAKLQRSDGRGGNRMWMVDVEVFGAFNSPTNWLFHHEKKVPDRQAAEQYVDKMKKFVDSKTISELVKMPKGNNFWGFSNMRFENESPWLTLERITRGT